MINKMLKIFVAFLAILIILLGDFLIGDALAKALTIKAFVSFIIGNVIIIFGGCLLIFTIIELKHPNKIIII